MSDQPDSLLTQITRFGLSPEEAGIYLHLVKNGCLSALQISRETHQSRTRVYRILDKLAGLDLVEQKLDSRGLRFTASPPQFLSRQLAADEAKLADLKLTLPNLITRLEALKASVSSASKVLIYHGVSGLCQVAYNATHADRILRVYEVEHLSDFIPKDTAENIRAKFVKSGILTRDLTNKTSFPDFTNVTGMIKNFSQYRYIPPAKLKITFEAMIYNDVYATYSYGGGRIFCVEIHNPELASMQKQIFDFIWSQAKPLKFTSPRGAARLG